MDEEIIKDLEELDCLYCKRCKTIYARKQLKDNEIICLPENYCENCHIGKIIWLTKTYHP